MNPLQPHNVHSDMSINTSITVTLHEPGMGERGRSCAHCSVASGRMLYRTIYTACWEDSLESTYAESRHDRFPDQLPLVVCFVRQQI